MPENITKQMTKIKEVAQSQSVLMDLSGGLEQLRGVVRTFSARVEDIDGKGPISIIYARRDTDNTLFSYHSPQPLSHPIASWNILVIHSETCRPKR